MFPTMLLVDDLGQELDHGLVVPPVMTLFHDELKECKAMNL